MLSRLRSLLIVPLFLLCCSGLRAQDVDYLRHGKIFNLCSFKRECSDCFACGKQRHLVKIKNNSDKKILSVSYSFYSDVYNKILNKQAKVEGKKIDEHQTGLFYICVPDGRHWIISEITYADGASVAFTLKDRLETFIQEPDECDCND